MNFSIIATPLIGACIGYVTNYIAVKMLFRPLKPVKIGKFTLPFTPGIIPKEKNRLAKGIGEIVGKRLVTKEGLEKMLLSDRVKSTLRQAIEEKLANSHTTLNDVMVSNLTEEKTQALKLEVTKETTAHIQQTLLDSDIGKLLSDQIVKSIKEYFQGGFLAMMMNDSILNSIGTHIGEGITKYIENIQSAMENMSIVIHTGNSIVDSIVNEKLEIAQSKEIEMKIDVAVQEDIGIPAMDLCVMVANSLDNAIEACDKMQPGSKKVVSIYGRYQHGYLSFIISNTVGKNVYISNNTIITDKVDKLNHGYGLQNIKNSVKRNHGKFKIECQDDVFTVYIDIEKQGN